MFVKNTNHNQLPLMDFTYHMPKRTKERFFKGWAPKFYQLVFSNISEEKFRPLYSSRPSKSNFPVNILASLEIIKAFFNYTDLEILDAFHTNIEVMWAVGIRNFGERELAERTLYDFRTRVTKYKLETGIDLIEELFYELVVSFLKKTKIKTSIQRMDSTMINANIKKLRRYELLWLIIIELIKKLTDEEKSLVPLELLDLTKEGAKQKLYDLSYPKETKQQTLDFLANGLVTLKNLFKDNHRVNNLEQYHVLLKVIDEQVDIVNTKVVARDPKVTDTNTIQSPYDLDATYRKKSGKEYRGYVTNVTETCSKDNAVQLITAVSIEKNCISDKRLLDKDIDKIDAETLIVDGGYDSKTSSVAGEISGTKVVTTKVKGRKLNKVGNILEFEIEEDEGIKRCPMGKLPYKSNYYPNQKHYKAWFTKKQCKNCPQKDQCHLTEQKTNNFVLIRKASFKAIEFEKISETDEFEVLRRMRAGVECTMSELKRRHKIDEVYAKCLDRVSYFIMLKVIACNFKRVAKVMVPLKNLLIVQLIKVKNLKIANFKISSSRFA